MAVSKIPKVIKYVDYNCDTTTASGVGNGWYYGYTDFGGNIIPLDATPFIMLALSTEDSSAIPCVANIIKRTSGGANAWRLNVQAPRQNGHFTVRIGYF